MAHVSHKLSNSFEGALAGGGDPATSPLYVFGPFLKLIVVAGVAQITFGASIWLAVVTIVVVSTMYRLVMRWVIDGSGGSGLSEEEFGSWAVKLNAGITFIEYTLTFLVSMAAMVTFIADRLPVLNNELGGIQLRTLVAIALSILTGWLVNRGPKVAARTFGPATAGVLLLLWLMIGATIWRRGLQLPAFDLQAFSGDYIGLTFGGYARILAVMTGIEIFANLVAAYDGAPADKSKKAFGSLLIIMGTTALTMLIVGPAIYALSDPTNLEVSVFTQTMDQLLPAPLPWLGTIVGISVLLSASAASAQGLQNLAVGLRLRHYLPAVASRQNQFGVATMPVWIEVGLVAFCFLFFGTNEETYLAIYAAGVFILLSMTGWAASKRLARHLRAGAHLSQWVTMLGTVTAAVLTTAATVIIFVERFAEGAWTYFLFIPLLYALFGYIRGQLGAPTDMEERVGRIHAERRYLPIFVRETTDAPGLQLKRILVPLDGSGLAEHALIAAQTLSRRFGAELTLLSSVEGAHRAGFSARTVTGPRFSLDGDASFYLDQVAGNLSHDQVIVSTEVSHQPVLQAIIEAANDAHDLVVMSTHGRSGVRRLLAGSVASQVIQKSSVPILLLRPTEGWRSRSSRFQHLLVALDGTAFSERILPHVRLLATKFDSRVLLLTVTEETAPDSFRQQLATYLERVAGALREDGINVETMVYAGGPARTIVATSEEKQIDLIMLATHGKGRVDQMLLGSVADRVIHSMPCPIFLVPGSQPEPQREPEPGSAAAVS